MRIGDLQSPVWMDVVSCVDKVVMGDGTAGWAEFSEELKAAGRCKPSALAPCHRLKAKPRMTLTEVISLANLSRSRSKNESSSAMGA